MCDRFPLADMRAQDSATLRSDVQTRTARRLPPQLPCPVARQRPDRCLSPQQPRTRAEVLVPSSRWPSAAAQAASAHGAVSTAARVPSGSPTTNAAFQVTGIISFGLVTSRQDLLRFDRDGPEHETDSRPLCELERCVGGQAGGGDPHTLILVEVILWALPLEPRSNHDRIFASACCG